jgi:isochorismate synthase EntC
MSEAQPNPHPSIPVAVSGAATLQCLQKAYPELAGQFTGLFSCSEGRTTSIAAVGAAFQLEARKEGSRIVIRLRRGDVVERQTASELVAEQDPYEQTFRALADFLDETRTWLMSQPGIGPGGLFLGGWKCQTRLAADDDLAVFTMPALTCRFTPDDIVVTDLVSPRDAGREVRRRIQGFLAFPYDLAPTAAPRISRREDIPACPEYVENLLGLLADIARGDREKVVICREVKLTLQDPVSPLVLLRQAAQRAGGRYEYVFQWAGGEAWVGLSPETLMRKQGDEVVVEPLAGTRRGSVRADKRDQYRRELLTDAKELEEHDTAARLFHERLSTVCHPSSVVVLESQEVVDFGYVQHLRSRMKATARAGVNVFNVLSAIYPPATIWGHPVPLSGERIRRYEKIRRDFFTGAFGTFSLSDDANFALAIRTAKVAGTAVHVYAGSGIVKGSDPYQEWIETINKMGLFLTNGFMVGS